MDKEKLSNIIDKSKLDIEEKRIFKEIFCEIIKTHENVIDDLKKQIINTYSNNNTEMLKISTLIIDKNDLKLYKELGFELLCENEEFKEEKYKEDLKYYSTAFLKCKYSDLKSYLDNIYEGVYIDKDGKRTSIKYKFFNNLNAIEKEKVLEKISNQYKIEFNTVYSPYSRRMIDIYLLNDSNLKDIDLEKIDLQIEKNNLTDVLQVDKYLVWNIKVQKSKQANNMHYTNAYGDKTNYIHIFDYEPYKYISADCKVIDMIKDEKNIKLISEEPDINFEIIKINEVDTSNIECFENAINIDPRLERLRTKSQIQNAISQYLTKPFKNCVIDILTHNDNKKEVIMYENSHKSCKNKEEFFIINNSKKIYIQFDDSNKEWFVEDFYNYLLDNLNDKYPEFKFIGVY